MYVYQFNAFYLFFSPTNFKKNTFYNIVSGNFYMKMLLLLTASVQRHYLKIFGGNTFAVVDGRCSTILMNHKM